MVAFGDRLRKVVDKHSKTILFIILGILVLSSISPEKKEALATQEACNLANTLEGATSCSWNDDATIIDKTGGTICMATSILGPKQSALDTCQANRCVVGTDVIGLNTYGCFNEVPNGLRAVSAQHCVEDSAATGDDKYPVLCIAYPPGDDGSSSKCNSLESQIAKPLQEIAPTLNCKTAYFATLFGGGLVTVVLLAAAL